MIDDKKIENAAFEYGEGISFEAFIDGAEWMQKEFLKDLWHPVSEKPKDNKVLFVQYHQLDRKDPWYITLNLGKITNWRDTVADFLIQRWCYIDDLLPK